MCTSRRPPPVWRGVAILVAMTDPFDELLGRTPPSARMDPVHIDSHGKACDFCMDGDPAVWAFPCGEAIQRINVGGMGFILDVPVEAGDWYACERCHPFVRGDRWAALAADMGFPEGSAGLPAWQAFRAARLEGAGYAWPKGTA